MAKSKLRDQLRRELSTRQARRSSLQCLREGAYYRSAAWTLFKAGLSSCGFRSADIYRLWNQPHPRNVSR